MQEAKCGYAIIVMALYWCTECIPLAVTALLPVILFPMMGILESTEVPSLFFCIDFNRKRVAYIFLSNVNPYLFVLRFALST